jgi:hypothetical protein
VVLQDERHVGVHVDWSSRSCGGGVAAARLDARPPRDVPAVTALVVARSADGASAFSASPPTRRLRRSATCSVRAGAHGAVLARELRGGANGRGVSCTRPLRPATREVAEDSCASWRVRTEPTRRGAARRPQRANHHAGTQAPRDVRLSNTRREGDGLDREVRSWGRPSSRRAPAGVRCATAGCPRRLVYAATPRDASSSAAVASSLAGDQ